MTLDIILPGTFTDPSGLPKAKHGTGVPGWGARWLAETVVGAEGAAISPWLDVNGKGQFNATAANRPTIATVAGHRVLSFDGAGDYLSNSTEPLVAPQQTVGMVVRLDPAATATDKDLLSCSKPPAGATDGRIRRSAAGTVNFASLGNSASVSSTLTMLPGQWCVVALANDSASSRGFLNGEIRTIATASTDPEFTLLYIGSGGTLLHGQVAEVVTWPDALTDAQLQQFYAAMRLHYASFAIA